MQRHGDKRVGLGQKLASGLGEEASRHRCNVKTIGIFKGIDQRPGNLVKSHGGPGAMVSRRIGDGLHGQDARAGVIHERNAEPLAIGPGDE
jgi:hypothetical protein